MNRKDIEWILEEHPARRSHMPLTTRVAEMFPLFLVAVIGIFVVATIYLMS